MKRIYYVGLDVHAESAAVAYTYSYSRKPAEHFGTCKGSIRNIVIKLRKLAKELQTEFTDLVVCYEAGPTGFGLARYLKHLGLQCEVVAVDRGSRKPGERIKTDKRDAMKLARALRNGDLKPVHIPPSTDEAVRDLSRARTDAADDLKRSKQRLGAFLLRRDHRYEEKTKWTEAHMRYLRRLELTNPTDKIILEEYLMAIDASIARIERIEQRLADVLETWHMKPAVEALMCLRGFALVSSMIVVSELGDLRRFAHPRGLMAFLGLVPGEHSSGTRRRRGSITKCGNTHVRWILIECAQNLVAEPNIGRELSKRQEGKPKKYKELSWRMQHRLHHKYLRLRARKKLRNKCIVAIARESVGFIWELLTKCEVPMPESQQA